MKSRTAFAIVAACCTSLSPLVAAPAFAAPATSVTEGTMAGICAANLAGLVNVSETLHDGTPVWSTAVENVVGVERAPSETGRNEIDGTRVGTGTPSYAGLAIAAGPYRIGGSVNMFGDQVATTKTWATSEFDWLVTYANATDFSFGCSVAQESETWTDPVVVDPVPAEGYYTNPSENNGGGDGNGVVHGGGSGANQSCSGFSNTHPFWGQNIGACVWTQTAPGTPGYTIPGYWTRNPTTPRTDLASTGSTVQNDPDSTEVVHEYNGGAYTLTGSWFVGQVVICISPSTGTKKGVPGEWRTQNGYTGTNCNTTYFNSAPWGGGSQTSNGTYISVPGV